MGAGCHLVVVQFPLRNRDVEYLFTDLLATCMHFWKNVCSGLLINFYSDFFFFFFLLLSCVCVCVCVCVCILIPYQIYLWQIFSPFSRMYFPVINNYLQCAETSLIWCSLICLLWLLFPLLLKSDKKFNLKSNFKELSTCILLRVLWFQVLHSNL